MCEGVNVVGRAVTCVLKFLKCAVKSVVKSPEVCRQVS